MIWEEHMLKTLLMSVAILLPATALAAPSGVTLSANGAMTVSHKAPGKHMLSNWNPPPHKSVIFTTLGAGNAYNPNNGWTIADPGTVGFEQWFAFPITPAADATVTQIVEAIGYVAGTNSVTIALMTDNGGVPGDVLQSKTVTNLDTFGNCCNVAVDKLKTGVPVKAGTTYWVAAILPKKKQNTTWDAWNLSTEDQDVVPAAFYNGTTWVQTSANYSAFAVYGK
jgi:hypothetical protein